MKQKYGFIEFETISEFEEWLNEQNVKRKINKLQAHHMYAPDYSCWPTDNALRRQNNIKYFHKNQNGWDDIAQHFSIFPDGHIVTGRSLEKTGIGIKGWNTGAIVVEIYGNFDKNHDVMVEDQKKSVIAAYALLAEKFNVKIDNTGIRPHCWFQSNGTYLGDYNVYKSAKSCPGTNFLGLGNSQKAFEGFYDLIKAYNKKELQNGAYNCKATILAEVLNVRDRRPDSNGNLGKIIFTLNKNEKVKLGYVNNNWGSIYTLDGKWGFVNVKYLSI